MRVSTAYSFDSTVYELQRRQDELTHAQEQMNSGKRVLKPGDDPTAAAQAERALVEEARGKQLQRTIDNSRNVMGLTESALGSAIELSQQAREALVLAGNGSYTDSGRRALAETLKQARDELFSVSNQTDAAGNLLFGRQGENSVSLSLFLFSLLCVRMLTSSRHFSRICPSCLSLTRSVDLMCQKRHSIVT